MTDIFLSYSSKDKSTADQLSKALNERGYKLTLDVDTLVAGNDWRDTLIEKLQEADGLVVLITKDALKSPFVLGEIGSARAFARGNSDSFIIPVILDEIEIPSVIQDLFVVDGKSLNINDIAEKIHEAISHHVATQEGSKKKDKQRKIALEGTVSDFVEPHSALMQARTKNERLIAFRWALLGFTLLLIAFLVAYINFTNALNVSTLTAQHYVVLGLRGVFCVGILIYGAKNAFTFSKANSIEATRSFERNYTSSFGEFFLKIFGASTSKSASREDLKDIFLHGNSTSNEVSVPDNNTSIQPEVLKSLTSIIKTLSTDKSDKKT